MNRYKERTVLYTVEPESWVKLLVRIRERIMTVCITIIFVSVLFGFVMAVVKIYRIFSLIKLPS